MLELSSEDARLKHDPEECEAAFRKIMRKQYPKANGDSSKSHHALDL
ncbi:hypothetical protein FBZ95_101385 [Bradyrhizobium sacchari]|uniref:Uncharacterized protein n=1 Tax=Bradyrhizobium sacchari TaxID=1399419 RepID=A0A560KPF3_9BRAD|nr:hypothetical protein FBZ95_101385 [Bradyrhizobium sacchari]